VSRYIVPGARFVQIAVAVIDDMVGEDGVTVAGRRCWCYAAIDGAGRAWYLDWTDGRSEKARWWALPDHPEAEAEADASDDTKNAGGSEEPGGGR
jgi:hypothetical protein